MVLTELLGADVLRADGSRLATLVDLAVRLGPERPPVTLLEVRTGRGPSTLLPWSSVAAVERSAVRLRPAGELAAAALRPDELLLRGHVLDTQIFDVAGKRLTRVGDAELVEVDGALALAAVDAGTAPILRRLGLRFLARHARSDLIDWSGLHLASGRGHALQLELPSARLHRLTAHELAELVARLPEARASEVLEAVHPSTAAGARQLRERTPEARPRHRYGRILRLRRRAPS